jgi:hypothetical protein
MWNTRGIDSILERSLGMLFGEPVNLTTLLYKLVAFRGTVRSCPDRIVNPPQERFAMDY